MPWTIAMTVAGQPPQTPPRRTWATPSLTPSTSISVPSIASAGRTFSVSPRARRSFSSADILSPLRNRSAHARLPGLLHVLPQLGHQFVGAAERPRVAQAVDEIHRQRLPVEVALEADQVDLDLAGLLAERRV